MRRAGFTVITSSWSLLIFSVAVTVAGCASEPAKPIIETRIVEKPVPVPCKVETPPECRDRYAVDELQPGADPVQVNRAVLAEIEQRAACETKLRAAIQGCNDGRAR